MGKNNKNGHEDGKYDRSKIHCKFYGLRDGVDIGVEPYDHTEINDKYDSAEDGADCAGNSTFYPAKSCPADVEDQKKCNAGIDQAE